MLASIEEQGKLTDELTGRTAGGRHQVARRGHLPALQAEAADQGADRPRGRARAAGRSAAGRSDAGPRGGGRGVPRRRRCRRRRGARRGATHPRRARSRGRRTRRRHPREVLGGRFAADGALVGRCRRKVLQAQKFRDYFEFSESLESMPSHRVLAVMRGEKEKVLALTFDGGDDDVVPGHDRPDPRHRHDLDGRGDTVAGRHRRAWRGAPS